MEHKVQGRTFEEWWNTAPKIFPVTRFSYEACGVAWNAATAAAQADLTEKLAQARLEMYYALSRLPIKSHVGSCTPESGCDSACAETAAFSDWIAELSALAAPGPITEEREWYEKRRNT